MKIFAIKKNDTTELLALEKDITELNARIGVLKQRVMREARAELPEMFQEHRTGYGGTQTKPDMIFTEDWRYVVTRNAK